MATIDNFVGEWKIATWGVEGNTGSIPLDGFSKDDSLKIEKEGSTACNITWGDASAGSMTGLPYVSSGPSSGTLASSNILVNFKGAEIHCQVGLSIEGLVLTGGLTSILTAQSDGNAGTFTADSHVTPIPGANVE